MLETCGGEKVGGATASRVCFAKMAKERTVRNAMSNSFGFGGTNASLVLSAVD